MDRLAGRAGYRICLNNCFYVVDSSLPIACVSAINASGGVYAYSNFRTHKSATQATRLSHCRSIGGGCFNKPIIVAQVQFISVPGENFFTATGGGVIYSLPTS